MLTCQLAVYGHLQILNHKLIIPKRVLKITYIYCSLIRQNRRKLKPFSIKSSVEGFFFNKTLLSTNLNCILDKTYAIFIKINAFLQTWHNLNTKKMFAGPIYDLYRYLGFFSIEDTLKENDETWPSAILTLPGSAQ